MTRGPIRRFARAGAAVLSALCLAVAADAEPEAPADAEPRPGEVVERLHGVLLDVMKRADELGYPGRYDRLAPTLEALFDLAFMAEKSVGRYWKQASAEDQAALVDTFSRYTIANYAGRFDHYEGGEFETLAEEASTRDTVLVRSRLQKPDGEEVKLDYRLRSVDGRWRIIDVYLDGTVSELALRRSEYSSLIKREGIKALLAALDERIEKLASQPAESAS